MVDVCIHLCAFIIPMDKQTSEHCDSNELSRDRYTKKVCEMFCLNQLVSSKCDIFVCLLMFSQLSPLYIKQKQLYMVDHLVSQSESPLLK